MNVKTARGYIKDIERICAEAVAFDEKHGELEDELHFLFDMVAYLGDYKKVLERLIGEAELKI